MVAGMQPCPTPSKCFQANPSHGRRASSCAAKASAPQGSSSQSEVSRPDGLTRRHALAALLVATCPAAAAKEKFETMEQLKGKDYGKERQRYSDYVRTNSGLQYQDIRVGSGQEPSQGATVSIDWDGYTIGYYGRPFQARNKAKGGSFGQGADRELYSFRLGTETVIPAIEEAVSSMKQGGIRRLIVPVELGYPDNDYNKKGPKPTTFSGQRALDFVLKNQGLIDKTLLIDVELVKVS